MKKRKKQSPISEEEQENLIQQAFTQKEVDDLLEEGFTKEQIAYVARERIAGDKQVRWIAKIIDILTWILPFPKG